MKKIKFILKKDSCGVLYVEIRNENNGILLSKSYWINVKRLEDEIEINLMKDIKDE